MAFCITTSIAKSSDFSSQSSLIARVFPGIYRSGSSQGSGPAFSRLLTFRLSWHIPRTPLSRQFCSEPFQRRGKTHGGSDSPTPGTCSAGYVSPLHPQIGMHAAHCPAADYCTIAFVMVMQLELPEVSNTVKSRRAKLFVGTMHTSPSMCVK